MCVLSVYLYIKKKEKEIAMTQFLCPVCKKELIKTGNSLKCVNSHCFDISKKGTVNLLLSNRSRHGDDKLMVKARTAFLNKGYYTPLLSVLEKMSAAYLSSGCVILDCGCGECWYTANIYEYLISCDIQAEMIGIDVSKEALNAGASRNKALRLAAASVFEIPLAEKSCDAVISLFSPFSRDEYLRVLKDGGIYITAFPLEDHLFELKAAVYEKPYRNSVSDTAIEGFELLEYKTVGGYIELDCNEDIMSLFSMTPYYYKTSPADRDKLSALTHLKTRISFGAAAYRREKRTI